MDQLEGQKIKDEFFGGCDGLSNQSVFPVFGTF
jgi:hypothetical protein